MTSIIMTVTRTIIFNVISIHATSGPVRMHLERRAALQCPDYQHQHRYHGIAAASPPTRQVRQFGWYRQFPNSTAKLYLTPVFAKKTPIVQGAKTAQERPPAPPISMFTFTRRPRSTKVGVYLATARTPLGRTPRTLKLGAGGLASFKPHSRWAFFWKTTVPLKGLLGTLIVGVRGAAHMLKPSVC